MFWKTRFGRIAVLAVMAAAFLAVSVIPSSAQGSDDKKVPADDRTSAFNDAANTEPVQDPPAPSAAPPYTFSGLMFGDYYYFGQSHDPAWDGQQAFWFRRIYFTFDYRFTPKLTTRFRLEMNSDGRLEGGSLTPYVKDASLRWTYYGRQQMVVGIEPSLSIGFVESVWGLRHIEKTPLDLYRWDSSRDTGLTLAGPLNDAGTLSYGVQFGTEPSDYAEIERDKAVRAAVRYERSPGLTLEGMFVWLGHDMVANRAAAQVFAAYRSKTARAGFLYARQEREAAQGPAAEGLSLDVYSGFGVIDLKPQTLAAFARVDRYADACPDCSGIDYLPINASAAFTLLVAGVEYFIHPSVRFSPNVEWVTYSTPGNVKIAKPKDDVIWRATFYWTW
jgi:hypothetical protein